MKDLRAKISAGDFWGRILQRHNVHQSGRTMGRKRRRSHFGEFFTVIIDSVGNSVRNQINCTFTSFLIILWHKFLEEKSTPKLRSIAKN